MVDSVEEPLAWVRRASAGKPYVWGSGEGGVEVSGLMAYVHRALTGQLTEEERTRLEGLRVQVRDEAERARAAIQDRVQAHPRLVATTTGAVRSLLELHGPVVESGRDWPVCEGCDYGGWEAYAPAWPCRTYLILVGEVTDV